jgi:hypothetical protein
MMVVRTPETCWAVHKRQVNELEKLLHLVGWFIWILWWHMDLQTLNWTMCYWVHNFLWLLHAFVAVKRKRSMFLFLIICCCDHYWW